MLAAPPIDDSTITPLDESFQIRQAHLADIETIVELHREAFADKFGGAFGRQGTHRGAEALALAWQQQGSRALRGMFVAEHEGAVVATTSLHTQEMGVDSSGAAERAFQQVLGFWGATRSLIALSLIDHRVTRDEAFITDVAVVPAYRRRGLARALLAHVEQEALRARKHYLGLYVSANNRAACELYRQLGFVEVRQRRSWLAQFLFKQRLWLYLQKPIGGDEATSNPSNRKAKDNGV